MLLVTLFIIKLLAHINIFKTISIAINIAVTIAVRLADTLYIGKGHFVTFNICAVFFIMKL